MPKEKKKVKSKGKGKKKVKKIKLIEFGPRGPTEKELLEMQIDELRHQLEEVDRDLDGRTEALEHARQLFETEVDSKVSCVAHLKRVLHEENGRRIDVQEQLQTERDLAELAERRALAKLEASDHSSEAAKSVFLQQKNELEIKLSQLEELRLVRNSQQAWLKKAEDGLNNKILASQKQIREEDISQVDKLLENREIFMQMCHDIRTEWRKVFKLNLPVFAKRQLKENVRLRNVCETTTKHLLYVQDENRTLKKQQKSLELEEEIQSSIEYNTKKRRACQEKRLKHLLQVSRDIKSATVREENFTTSCPENENTFFLEEISDKAEQDSLSEEKTLNSKIDSIRKHEIERCRLEDKFYDMNLILKDQISYKNSLDRDLDANIDRNGVLMSAILRAGKIFQTRCGKLDQGEDLDYDMLIQIRSLLDLKPGNC